MKIGVNARFLNLPYTGIGQYTRYLFESLAKENSDVRFLMVMPGRPEISFPKNMHVITLPEKFPGSSGMRKTYWEQVQVPAFFLKHNVDLAHFPYPSNPWKKFPKPVLVTVHDTIPWTLPEYRRSFSTRLYQDRCKNAIALADHILTVSESSKKDIIDLTGIADSKITVTYNSVAPQFFKKIDAAGRDPSSGEMSSPSGRDPSSGEMSSPSGRDPSSGEMSSPSGRDQILKKYGINPDRPFLLYSGGYDERKNVRHLVDVFLENVAPKNQIDLVLAGGKSLQNKLYESFDYLTKKGEAVKFSNLQGKLVTTGFVEAEDFPALYQSCYAYLSLSLKEGFNLPLLEAAVSGAIIVASDIPVHHEVLGTARGIAVTFCDPEDNTALSEILNKLITDREFYIQQKQKSENFICPYSWIKTASQVMHQYKKLL